MSKKKISFSLEQETVEELQAINRAEGGSFVALIEKALREYINKYFDKMKR